MNFGKSQELVKDDPQVSKWCDHQVNLQVDSWGNLWDDSLGQHWGYTNVVIRGVPWIQ